MRVIDEVNLDKIAYTTDKDKIKEALNIIFWTWFETARNRKVTSVRVWFIKKTLYVKDLEKVFELLFGPQPEPTYR